VEELRKQITSEREKLVDLLTATGSDRDSISTQLTGSARSSDRFRECVVAHLLEEKGLLTPDQQAEFNETIRRRVCPLGGHGRRASPARASGTANANG